MYFPSFKKNLRKKHFYTVTPYGIEKKSEFSELFKFYELIERTVGELPSEIEDDVINYIVFGLKNLYSFIWKKDRDDLLKLAVYIEEKAEELEKREGSRIKGFIDFSKIHDERLRALNRLRINLRLLESQFWLAAREIVEHEDSGSLLYIPHFLNVSSKYVFYYIVSKLDEIPYLEKLSFNEKVNGELFEKYRETYSKMKLSDVVEKFDEKVRNIVVEELLVRELIEEEESRDYEGFDETLSA